MKNKLQLLLLVCCCFAGVQAQNSEKSWSFGLGTSAVDVYPVGEDAPQGDYFDEYFNVNDHWNMGFYFDVNKHITTGLSLQLHGSYNQISKWGQNENSERIVVDNLDYIGADAMLNYSFFNNSLISPFLGVGGGYTWIEEGPFNTFSLENGGDNLVGAGTVNGAAGLYINLTDNVAIKLQSTYKHSFEDYLTKHFQHNLGVTFSLGKKNEEPKEIADTDGDGVNDENDLCPNIAGKKEYAGCPDTDGDGIPDSLDKCPNEKGSVDGCPQTVLDTTPVAVVESKEMVSAVYFEYDSAELDNNAKEVLDLIYKNSENSKEINITVNGYADNIGSDGYNKELSQKRVDSVMGYLTSKGIDKNLFTTNNYGEENPAATNATKEGRALNRRAQLKVTLK
jgi:OOP family OmpA-OmpF porin